MQSPGILIESKATTQFPQSHDILSMAAKHQSYRQEKSVARS